MNNKYSMKLGCGWMLSAQEYIEYVASEYYLYHDADGTEHYLVFDTVEQEFYDQDGLGLTLIQSIM